MRYGSSIRHQNDHHRIERVFDRTEQCNALEIQLHRKALSARRFFWTLLFSSRQIVQLQSCFPFIESEGWQLTSLKKTAAEFHSNDGSSLFSNTLIAFLGQDRLD